MDINSIREAVTFSPDNLPLRILLAEALIKEAKWKEAEVELKFVLERDPTHQSAKRALARVYFNEENFSATIIILEELAEVTSLDSQYLILLSKSYLRNRETGKAIEYYRKSLELNPDTQDEELDSELRSTGTSNDPLESVIESLEQSLRIEKPKINFDHVGGMSKVKDEIRLKIIEPLKHPDLYKAYGKKIGGGILLYGPPGCGKTHLARATAGQINAKFISVGIHDVLNMWLGNSEKQLHDLFERARRLTPCVIFFDEIDALGASRSDMRNSNSRMLINQFLTELDGVEASNDGLLVLGATNAPWHLDIAFRRPGRFDRIIFVHPPDAPSREGVLRILLDGKPKGTIDYSSVAKATDQFSGADLMSLVDRVIEEKLASAFKTGTPEPIQTRDLLSQVKSVKPSTKEWFVTARNYALYSNESGLYDDILDYLKISK